MNETERVSRLIADIYDASLDRSLWRPVLEKTCEYIKGQSGALLAQGPTQKAAHLFFEWGTDPQFIESYQKTYAALNPTYVPTMLRAKPGAILATTDILPQQEIIASRFYKEWLAPQGLIDAISVTFEKSALSYAVLTIQRSNANGMVDDQARWRMSLVAPHFHRAIAIGKVIDLHKVEAAALADSLDGLAAAFFLVDAAGHLVHANASAQTMLDEGSLIRATGGKFTVVDAQADRTLHEIFINADEGDLAVGTKGIAVSVAGRDGERYVVHVLPLTTGARRKACTTYSAIAAVFVRKVVLDLPHPLEVIANSYDLTPAEMRVLMMIVQLGGVPQVAPVLGISEPTVKTHLQRIFAKTDTNRQADLVKLVAGYMSPFG